MNNRKLKEIQNRIEKINSLNREIKNINETLRLDTNDLRKDNSIRIGISGIFIALDPHVSDEKLRDILERQLESIMNQRDVLAIELGVDD